MLDTSPALSKTVKALLPGSKEEPTKSSDQETKKESFYRCKICKNVILGPNAENLYVDHIQTCQANNFECSICFKKFAHKRGLNNHLRITHLVFD